MNKFKKGDIFIDSSHLEFTYFVLESKEYYDLWRLFDYGHRNQFTISASYLDGNRFVLLTSILRDA